jgi:hypothetical protein
MVPDAKSGAYETTAKIRDMSIVFLCLQGLAALTQTLKHRSIKNQNYRYF